MADSRASQGSGAPVVSDEHTIRMHVLAGFLRSGRVLDHASSGLLLGTFLLVLHPGSPLFAAGIGLALLLSLIEKYFAWRVALDAELFAILLAYPEESEMFDASLAAFLGRAEKPALRSLQSRWEGARRLFYRQAAFFGLQALTVFIVAIALQF